MQMDDANIPMIEEYIDTGLAALLDNYQPNYVPGGEVFDTLEGSYKMIASQPLPEFSHAYADAFAAIDLHNAERKIYAMVCDNTLPYRQFAINEMKNVTNQNLILPLAAGTVKCSHLNESRFVIFFEQPQGTPLSELLASYTTINESKVIDLILKPACRGLMAMRERKVHHGHIRPEAFYIGEMTMFGECFSAPCGTLAHYLYEPVERAMADTLGHGEANEKADVYALGILAMEVMIGLDKFRSMPRETFISLVMKQGVYNVFTENRSLPDSFQDFFRGIFNDNAADRWGLDQVEQFISGKRFNLIAPSAPKDASRPMVFADQNIFSRRLLANVLHRNWREAVKDVRALRLDRWCEMSLHRPELAESIERAMRSGAERNATERQISDMMMRIFITLDPAGPLRTKSLSLRPDTIGIALATLIDQKGAELTQLLSMIENDSANYWAQHSDITKSPEISQAVWLLQKVRPYVKSKALGFGIERVLYELNPSLSCQSPLLRPYHITTAEEALKTLDVLAKNVAPGTSLVDRHIAAFIAAKIELTKELTLDDLTIFPSLTGSQDLIMMRLLARAQHKYPRLHLVGLCAWSGMLIEKMIDAVHNRVIRRRQKLQLKKLVSTGLVREVFSTIVNREVLTRDTNGFAQALALHEINNSRIEFLKSPLVLEYNARRTGGRMAVSVSYMGFMVVVYFILSNALGL